jgi:NAD(P)-dependent dehydrogenase (short-subunit alcohol dehydrogenase family)
LGLLENRIAIITGSSRGIGRGIAIRFGREGANVVVNHSRSPDEARLVVKEIERWGSKAIAVKADVSSVSDVDRLVSECEKEFGEADALVNNAGVLGAAKPIHELTEEEWDRVISNNLKSTFLCIKRVLPSMLRRGSGRIINISSVDAFTGEKLLSAYSASKGGILSLSKELSLELAPKGICVNVICPGAVDTPMMRKLDKEYPGAIDAIVSRTPAGRLANVDDIAAAALYLASDDAKFVHGAHIVVDGAVMNNVW